MEFFNHQHSRYTGIKGFITIYNDAIRYQYMITDIARQRAKVLIHWETYGIASAKHAFAISSATLYAWRASWMSGGKKLEALNPKSRAPHTKRKRLWPAAMIAELQRLRSRDVFGKIVARLD